ncbi:hypothetical protein ACFL58_02705 [Elusimicrobiota bacterium]
MTILFFLAALYCTGLGILIWFFPEILIEINDWLTEKTLLHEKIGVISRIIIGSVFLGIAAIFWWVIFS